MKYWFFVFIRVSMFSFLAGSSVVYYLSEGQLIVAGASALFAILLMARMIYRSDFFVDSRPKYQSIAKARNTRSLVIPVV
jgi:hypothetical protein